MDFLIFGGWYFGGTLVVGRMNGWVDGWLVVRGRRVGTEGEEGQEVVL